MIDGKRVLALIPARAGSKGLPGKNVRIFAGKPLLAWPIAAARASRYVDDVLVSTDSPEFAAIAEQHGARAPFLRPVELASDAAPSIGFILHALDWGEVQGARADYLVLLEPTSPLTEACDIDAALETLVAAGTAADAIVGISALEAHHPTFAVRVGEGARLSPYQAGSFAALPRRQDIEPLFCLDGSLYISSASALRREGGFCHERTLGYITPKYKAMEVDDLVDFVCLEAVAANLELIRASEES
jgi:N-acylneuraminate cytidylyltransferase/CMP-N,N'-diacetyllegionaminic acid synthase